MTYPRRSTFVGVLAVALTAGSIGAEPAASRFEFQQPHMGTTVRIILYAGTAAAAERAAAAAFARIAELDARLSDYREASELMALCRAAGGPPVRVSDDLFAVLAAAQQFARLTGGAFDVTVGPVARIWRRARARGEPPDAQELSSARRRLGYAKLELSDERRTARLSEPGMLLDLGGIAKGYAADQALAVLVASRTAAALVALGGDVVVGDGPPGKAGWEVAIAPLGPGASFAVPSVTLRRAAVSTSGDAEQFLEHGRVRYSHVVHPGTGHAVEGRGGATVIAGDGMTADALATSLAVLGAERGVALTDRIAAAAALIVRMTAEGPRVHRSARWPGAGPVLN